MTTRNFFTLLFAAILLTAAPLNAQSYFADTVWTKVTDQSMGFYRVKFSNHDSIIVGHGYEMDLFYDANTGNEITRIPGNNEVFFFNNDLNFIKLNSQRNCFEIFDASTYLVTDTLENDGVKLLPHYSLSNDESRLVCVKSGGLRVWDIATKKIIITKDLMTVPNLVKTDYGNIGFNCDDTKILIGMDKIYQISVSPPSQYMVSNVVIFNTNTLDSVGAFNGFGYFVLSNNCQYIAFQLASDNYGVTIYDYNTKKLKRQLPINGFSLTGIEFSPDDKYIVTSGHGIFIWDITTGLQTHFYPGDWESININHNGTRIISSGSQDFWLWIAHFGDTFLQDIINEATYLYPNPTTGEVSLNNEQSGLIKIFSSNGILNKVIKSAPTENGINFNVSDLPNGEYFIFLEGKKTKTYKLIINK